MEKMDKRQVLEIAEGLRLIEEGVEKIQGTMRELNAKSIKDIAEQLIVEETSSTDKYVAFDLVCRGEDDRLLTLQQDLADNAQRYEVTPVQ